MSAAHDESLDASAPDNRPPELRAASLSALEEALLRALESASREQVIQRVIDALPTPPSPDRPGRIRSGLHGKAAKVSVSLPTDLTEAVRARTGAGGFSRYVTEAVQERVRLDLLEELSAELTAEFGPVDDELVRQAIAEWPDYRRE